MKLTKLAIIAVTIAVASITGCDEAAIVEDLIGDHSVEGIGTLAELKQIEGESAAPPTNPVNLEKILNFPWEDATEEKRAAYWELVTGLAVNVNVLDITDCTPNPLIIEVGREESIEIKNRGTTSHTFFFRGNSVTIPIPPGGSRGVVVTEFTGFREGLVSYGCGNVDPVGIFYINPGLTVKPSEKQRHITFKVVEFLFPDGSNGPALEKVKVTVLDGSDEVRETATDGSVTFKRDLPLTVRLEKEGQITTEVTVVEEEEIVLPSRQKNVSFRVIEPLLPEGGVFHPHWPRGFTKNGPGIEGVAVTCLEGSDEGIKETDDDGGVTFFGTPPLTVRIEKEGYITIEAVAGEGSEIVFPNEWPPELDLVIEQLELAELIASGELILSWRVEPGGRGFYGCSLIHIGDDIDRNRPGMVWTLIHEAMHAKQAIESKARCNLLIEDWSPSKEGQAWIAVLEKDLRENGPVPGFDDAKWGVDKPLSENPLENQASFYAEWHMGPVTRKRDWDGEEELKKLYQFAPNRCQYLEDRFGPPPPR